MRKVTVGVRIDPTRVDRLDRVAAEMTRRAAGAEVKRGDAARVAMERGIDSLEKELGLEALPAVAAAKPAKKGVAPARKPTK
jgi:hypothetical protein